MSAILSDHRFLMSIPPVIWLKFKSCIQLPQGREQGPVGSADSELNGQIRGQNKILVKAVAHLQSTVGCVEVILVK